jgi:hypothetical protein
MEARWVTAAKSHKSHELTQTGRVRNVRKSATALRAEAWWKLAVLQLKGLLRVKIFG